EATDAPADEEEATDAPADEEEAPEETVTEDVQPTVWDKLVGYYNQVVTAYNSFFGLLKK
ncbi:hypothetical protein, partial [Escherichia coli]|uniref:hypothetical protein n=1 Tax=Escherichia coli TaxID=562 RepID=UPI001CCA5BE1